MESTVISSNQRLEMLKKTIAEKSKKLKDLEMEATVIEVTWKKLASQGLVEEASEALLTQLTSKVDLEKKITPLKAEIEFLENEKKQIENIDCKTEILGNLKALWSKMQVADSTVEKRIIQSVVKRLEYSPGDKQLTFHLNSNLCDKTNLVRMSEEWRDEDLVNELFPHSFEPFDSIEFYHILIRLDKCFLTQKYLIEGRSIAQIAKEVFSSRSTIQATLKKFGIPLRESHLNHGHPSQPKFGEKVRKGVLGDHVTEKRVIQTVMLLRAEGFSLRQIAEVLNQMKVPTKERGKKWLPEMIRRILSYVRNEPIKTSFLFILFQGSHVAEDCREKIKDVTCIVEEHVQDKEDVCVDDPQKYIEFMERAYNLGVNDIGSGKKFLNEFVVTLKLFRGNLSHHIIFLALFSIENIFRPEVLVHEVVG